MDCFRGFAAGDCITAKGHKETQKSPSSSASRIQQKKNHIKDVKYKTVPIWCCIPGTPFRVCLTRSFCHGKIYCSLNRAKLVNFKLGISWNKWQVFPLNQKINVAGIEITCFDVNHCPGCITHWGFSFQ